MMFDNILICATNYVFYRNLKHIGEHNRTCARISRCACMRMCVNIYELSTNAYDIHTHRICTPRVRLTTTIFVKIRRCSTRKLQNSKQHFDFCLSNHKFVISYVNFGRITCYFMIKWVM